MLKLCHYLNDVDGHGTELYFLRDIESREVDFLIVENRRPWFAVEVKSSATDIAKNLNYFNGKLCIPFLYHIVDEKNVDVKKDKIRIISREKILAALV